MSFAVLYNFEIMVCLFYTSFPKYIKHVICGTAVRVLRLHSGDWSSKPPNAILNDDGKKYFDINETPGHGGHSEIYTIKRYVLPGFQLAESSLNRDSPCQGALRTMITTPT